MSRIVGAANARAKYKRASAAMQIIGATVTFNLARLWRKPQVLGFAKAFTFLTRTTVARFPRPVGNRKGGRS